MEIRPYKLICDSELASISARLQEVWGHWCAHWLPDAKAGTVSCMAAENGADELDRGRQEWRRFSSASGVELRVELDAALPTRLASHAFEGCVPRFGPSEIEPSRLLADLMKVMLDDLALRVFRAAAQPIVSAAELIQDASSPGPQIWERGSGALAVRFVTAGKPLHVLLSESMVRELTRDLRPALGPHEPPSARRACLGAQRVRLELWTGETQIELGVLRSLAPGDLILLDIPISEPLRVAVDGKSTQRYAFLGRLGERKAMQLLPSNRS